MKIGLVGCGSVADYGHLPAIGEVEEVELIALADLNERQLKEQASKYDVKHTFTDYRNLLEMKELEAVVVTTPANTHHRIVLDALDAGKHVLCEKPISDEPDKGWEMVKASKATGKILAVCFEYRLWGPFKDIKVWLDKNLIGPIHVLRLIYNWNGPNGEGQRRKLHMTVEGGPIYDCGVHYFDLGRWYLNSEYKQINAIGVHVEGYENPDHVIVTVEFENGTIGLIEESYIYTTRSKDWHKFTQVDVIGTNGAICYLSTHGSPGVGELRVHSPEETIVTNYEAGEKPFAALHRAFAESVKRGEIVDIASGEDGVKAIEAAGKALNLARREKTM